MSGHVFSRATGSPPRISHAHGVEMYDEAGRRYLDAAGGAIVVGVGHGRGDVVAAMAEQAGAVAYAHGSVFTSEALETYAEELADVLPVEDPRVYPVAGGSEAVETALKMARAYHLARGEDRAVVVGRVGAYHGNSRGALDVSGRPSLRRPYEPWLGHAQHTSTPYEYRCPFPDSHPDGCGARHAQALEELIGRIGPGKVAAFIAEPVAGAALGACVPPGDYWAAVTETCRRHGVLVIADEVMTGFGRTGAWFGSDHWGVRPDLVTAGKGASSGYWPLGLAVASGPVHETISAAGFVHGFTYSHHVVGAATGLAVLRRLREEELVAASAARGAQLQDEVVRLIGDHPNVGNIRGRGLLVGVEFVADRESREPFERSARVTERVVAAARELGLLVYSSTGCADGTRGDLVLLGPPLVVTAEEVTEIAALLARAVVSTLPPT